MSPNPVLNTIPPIQSPTDSSSEEDNEIVIIDDLRDRRNSVEQLVHAMKVGCDLVRLKEVRVR